MNFNFSSGCWVWSWQWNKHKTENWRVKFILIKNKITQNGESWFHKSVPNSRNEKVEIFQRGFLLLDLFSGLPSKTSAHIQTWKFFFFTPARFEQELFYPRKCVTCDKSEFATKQRKMCLTTSMSKIRLPHIYRSNNYVIINKKSSFDIKFYQIKSLKYYPKKRKIAT